ncbi:hypothetical protein G6F65_020640 [Rhizopus arrhizus]|nr:hypothetical protein G6F65_020640 [Rhizopus arrhizus]
MPRISMPVIIGLVGMSALAIIEPYRMRRITSFLDPWADQQGDGYQLSNALMAVGRGEWTGGGLGNSVQKLYYLPEAHTDFIFSVTAEEFGFLGTCVIVALYALLVGRTFWLGMRCHADLRLDRREPGHPADQGPDPAADLLRRFVGADDLRGDGPAAARVL